MATAIDVALPRTALQDLGKLLENAEHIEVIENAVRDEAPSYSTSSIASRIAKRLAVPEVTVRSIIRVLANLSRTKHEYKLTPQDVIDMFDRAVTREATKRWLDEHSRLWETTKPLLARLVDRISADHPLMLSQKAELLTFLHQNILRDIRIVTDVRPIFDEDALEVQELIVTHSLVITYSDGARSNKIHFCMDTADVARLRALCDRADLKATTVSKKFNQCGVNSFVIGNEEDA